MSNTIKQKVQYQLEFNGIGKANTALNGFKNSASGAGQSADNLTDSVFKGAFAAKALEKAIQLTAQALKAMTDYFKESALAAADVNEQWNKFTITMGERSRSVAAEINRIAEASNRNRYELMQGAAAMQDLIYPMGVARVQAAGMSRDFVALAVDLSSFNNVALDDALGALRSGIAGMSRPLRRLGVDVRLTAVNAELLRMGITGGSDAATEAERVLAIYNIAMRQSSDAQGDAARTAYRARNVMRGFTADWKEASVEIGQSFIPVIEQLTPLLRDELGNLLPMVKDLANDIAKSMLENGPAIINVVSNLGQTLIASADAAFQFAGFLGDVIVVVAKAITLVPVLGESLEAIAMFPIAFGEAETALNDWNSAEDKAMVTEQAATLVTSLYADAMSGTAEQASFLIDELEKLEMQGANVHDVIENLRIRHEELTHEEEIGSLVIGELSAKTQDLGIEDINTARAAIKLAIAQEQLNDSLAVGPTATAGRIADLQEYRRQLDELADSMGAAPSSGTGSVGSGSTPGKPDVANKRQFDFKDEVLAARETAQDLVRINAEKNANILAAQRDLEKDLEDLRESKIDRAIEAEEAEWMARVEISRAYAGDMSDFMVERLKTGFADLDVAFAKMMENWALKMVGSGLLEIFGSIISGGATKGFGLAGQFLGKK